MEAVYSLQREMTHFVQVCVHTWMVCSDSFKGCRSRVVCSRRTVPVAATSEESLCLIEQ